MAANGDFAALPGIDRIIVFCQGPRMILTVDAEARELRRGEPTAAP